MRVFAWMHFKEVPPGATVRCPLILPQLIKIFNMHSGMNSVLATIIYTVCKKGFFKEKTLEK